MKIDIQGEFIDAADISDLLRSISNLIKVNIMSGGFRPADDPNHIEWTVTE